MGRKNLFKDIQEMNESLKAHAPDLTEQQKKEVIAAALIASAMDKKSCMEEIVFNILVEKGYIIERPIKIGPHDFS